MVDDLLHVGQESHVQHPISLIQDEIPDATELDVASLHKVQQTTRSRHEDIAGIQEILGLMPCSNTSVNLLYVDACANRKLPSLLVDLCDGHTIGLVKVQVDEREYSLTCKHSSRVGVTMTACG